VTIIIHVGTIVFFLWVVDNIFDIYWIGLNDIMNEQSFQWAHRPNLAVVSFTIEEL